MQNKFWGRGSKWLPYCHLSQEEGATLRKLPPPTQHAAPPPPAPPQQEQQAPPLLRSLGLPACLCTQTPQPRPGGSCQTPTQLRPLSIPEPLSAPAVASHCRPQCDVEEEHQGLPCSGPCACWHPQRRGQLQATRPCTARTLSSVPAQAAEPDLGHISALPMPRHRGTPRFFLAQVTEPCH